MMLVVVNGMFGASFPSWQWGRNRLNLVVQRAMVTSGSNVVPF